MSNIGNLISLLDPLTTIASVATTLNLPGDHSRWEITGSQSFSKLIGPPMDTEGAIVLLQGAASAAVVLQHTANPSTAGQMDLRGGDIRLSQGDIVVLQGQANKTWRLLWKSVGLNEITVASATSPAIPDYADAVILTGTVATTELVPTNIRPGRILAVRGTDGTGPALTDTAVASTAANKMHLSAALTLALGSTVTFMQATNGSWWEIGRGVNG